MTMTTWRQQFVAADAPVCSATDARMGRVWKAPRAPEQGDGYQAPRGSWLAMVAAASMVAAGAVAMSQIDNGPSTTAESVVIADQPLGSMYRVVDQVGARTLWEQGITGSGVNVAVIDTGVAAVDELTAPGKLVAAVDLSPEQFDDSTAYLDSFGHGTHIAGIIAGRQPGADPALAGDHPEWFMGVAPDAGIVSVKVAGRDGAVSLSSLVTGIDWVVAHADDFDIRVINLAFSGDGASPAVEAALFAAVERAWDAGIVVVTAAGNDGADSNGLVSPATDPYVIAVGAVEATADGVVVAEFASHGDGVRNPDIAAPGAHIESLRAPGSYADVEHPEGFVDGQRFLASGSSQSAAVVSGVAALLIDSDPTLTPDQVKAAMVSSATEVVGAGSSSVGTGIISAAEAVTADPADAHVQTWNRTESPVAVSGLTGMASPHTVWRVSSTWASASWMSASWMSASWMSASWMSASWMSASWMSASWMSASWMSASWMSASWMSASWM